MRPKLEPGEKGARDRLVDAFWERARVRPVAEITVDELCSAAGCRRSTFYYHFDGIDELRAVAVEQTGVPALLADEFAATMTGTGELPYERFHERTREFNDVCTVAYLNWGALEGWGAVDYITALWLESVDADAGSLAPAKRAILAFAACGFLGALAYRGATGNTVPYAEVASEMHHIVAPALAEAILGQR